jgi:peptidoglycan biosynthesis protein MviN/MurJ (putative lipid II flippase)
LPLALPFAARSIASQSGAGGLATFNYAWKLVELPLLLAIQLVATLSFPVIAAAFAQRATAAPAVLAGSIRHAFALAWTLACAAAAALLVGAPALTDLLFGYGRMDAAALARVAQWGQVAAWGLLPQALIAVALTVMAAQARMKAAVVAYALALAVLMAAAAMGANDGRSLMGLLNALFAAVALVTVAATGARGQAAGGWLPWRTFLLAAAALSLVAVPSALGFTSGLRQATAGLAAAVGAAGLVLGLTWLGSAELRAALRR